MPNIYAVDPAQRKATAVLCPDGTVMEVKDFKVFIQTLQPGDIVVTESTAHLFYRKDRIEVLQEAERLGVAIMGMRSTQTSRARKELGIEKGDSNDARAIQHYYLTKPALFYRLRIDPTTLGTKTTPNTPRFDVNKRLVELRRNKYEGYDDLHDATVKVAAEVALSYGLSMRNFKRLLGFHGNGYPNIARSNRNKHGAGKAVALRKGKMQVYRKTAIQYYQSLRAQALTPRQVVGPITSTRHRCRPNCLDKLSAQAPLRSEVN